MEQLSLWALLGVYATRFGIRRDEDGLLACGMPGSQITWMDAKIGERTVTPRVGKPVEVNALWINALRVGAKCSPRWQDEFNKAAAAFRTRFWNREKQCLYDVIDCDHITGRLDASFRLNQIFAIGGLPLNLLLRAMALQIVVKVEARLWTPLGLRSLAPEESAYAPHYMGGVQERDSVYHQGTVWPWLAGAFVEAWIRVRDNVDEAKEEAREKFLTPVLAHLDEAWPGPRERNRRCGCATHRVVVPFRRGAGVNNPTAPFNVCNDSPLSAPSYLLRRSRPRRRCLN